MYEVKLNNKYGVLNEDGEIVVNIAYDKIGFPEKNNMVNSLFIIKELVNDKEDAIVVSNGNKYGLVNLVTGGTIIKCELDRIYYKIDESQNIKCYIKVPNQEKEIELNRYIEYINTKTVVTN